MFFKGISKRQKKHIENEELLHSLDGRHIRYVIKKNPGTYQETIIGKDGIINVYNNRLTIVCSNEIVFSHPLKDLKCSELMSLNGVTFRYKEETTEQNMLIIAYYKYHRK